MEIVVCVKQVPDFTGVELRIDSGGRDIDRRGLEHVINEWDDYALELALRLKASHGGRVTVISVGGEEVDKTLRRCLAKGADAALRVTDKRINTADPFHVAKALAAAVKKFPFDLVLTGVQASDDGYAIVGPAVAEILGIPSVTLAKSISVENGRVVVRRELEGGLEEIVEVELPALVGVQTGVVELSYVSVLGIRMAMRKEIRVSGLEDLGVSERDLGGPSISVEELYLPKSERRAELVTGSPDEVASKIVEVLRSRGFV